MTGMDVKQFDALMRAAIEWSAHNGLTVDGHFEAHYGITSEVAAAVRAELIRIGVARESDARGLWFLNQPIAEIALRAAELADDLDHERGLHQVTKADLGHNIRAVHKLRDDRDDAHRALRLARAAHLRAEDDLTATKRRVWALAAAAAVLAVALVWAVIA